nr:hypothetical protein [Tanacetum cinerariifolium]
GRDRRHRGRNVQGVPAEPFQGRVRGSTSEPGDRRRHAFRCQYPGKIRRHHLRLHRPDWSGRSAVLGKLLSGLPSLPERGRYSGHSERHAFHA